VEPHLDTDEVADPVPLSDNSETQKELSKTQQELSETKTALTKLRTAYYKLNRQCLGMQARIKKHEAVELELRLENEKLRKRKFKDELDGMAPVPAALFKVMSRRKQVKDWKQEPEVTELSLSVLFRSASAYRRFHSPSSCNSAEGIQHSAHINRPLPTSS
jgi:septal ring factor EnvC (AmiA/AmiB activator)